MISSEALLSSGVSINTEGYSVTHRLAGGLGQVSLIGQCLATPTEFEVAAKRALATGDATLLSDLAGNYTTLMDCDNTQTIVTDLAGQFRFCWQETTEGVRLSLDDRHFNAAPNISYLGSYILSSPDLMRGQTGVQGVRRLEGGQVARFASGLLTSIVETDIHADSSATLAEAASDLRQVLTEAVVRRTELGKVVTSDFSGGLDSTTLALLAADALPQGMDAFINYRSGLAVGDLYFAQQIARTHPSIRLHAQQQDADALPFKNMRRQLAAGVLPDSWTISRAQSDSHLSVIQSHGGQLHLLGEGGDGVLSPPTTFVVDLARQGDMQHLRQFAQAYGRLMNVDPQQIYDKAIYDAGRMPVDDLHDIAKQLRNPQDLLDSSKLSRYSWLIFPEQHISFLTTPLRHHLSERAEQLADEQPDQPPIDLANATSLTELRTGGDSQYYLQRRAEAFGIDVHAPFLDGRVIRAALQVPAHLRTVPGVFKPILHKAFADTLPRELLSRTSKSAYDGEYYRGLRASWDDVITLMTKDCRLAELGIIEPGKVIQELYKLDTGQRGLMMAIEKVITAELWLRQQEEKA